ncbi:MAG: hypothetical protein OXE45_10495 [bacterium]|nr:hypothetical protein [bacterium]
MPALTYDQYGLDASNPDHTCERLPLGVIHLSSDHIWYFVAPRGSVHFTSMLDEVAVPHRRIGATGVVQQLAPLQWPTTLPCNASTPMKYFLPGDSPVNVVLSPVVVFSV